MRGRTTFVIAQRLSTIQQADQILVLEAGRIVQRGRPRELLPQPPYRQIYDLQFALQEEVPRQMPAPRRPPVPAPVRRCRPRGAAGGDEPAASCRRGAARGGDEDALGKAYDGRIVRRTWAYVRPYRGTCWPATALMICIAGANLAQPFLIKIAIDQAIPRATCACWP